LENTERRASLSVETLITRCVMSRKHWTHRMPRTTAKWALVAILVPFFLVGCVSMDKARQLFDMASQVCEIVDGVRQCLQN
ncbi:hypothetical protein, partial [Escherichia coli]|uniref:hypothetical protein n=2 Tax=Escherichia coli TaxID=562 RepID=UPI001F160B4B